MSDHREAPPRAQAGRLRTALALMISLLLGLGAPAAAADTQADAARAGRVISSVGPVHARDAAGEQRPLAQGDAVYPGETLTLGSGAHAQLRMRDDALIGLEAGSRFAIAHYADADGGEGGSAIMRLLRGAMRTITGAIGSAPADTYRVETPVATVGVRGTQYALHYCAAACAGEDRAAGLYGRVDAGAVSATNEAASRVFRQRDYFYVAGGDTAPRAIVRPPAGILAGGAISRGTLQRSPGVGAYDDALAGDGPEDPLDDTADGTGDVVGDTVEGGTELLGDSVEGGADALEDAAAATIDLADDALDGDGGLEGTLDDGADLAGDTLDQTGGLTDETLDGATDTLNDTIDNTLDGAGDLLGGGD